jgi:O-antigen/teichoic acid export membrane protein
VAAAAAGAPLLAARGRADAAPLEAGRAWRTARASLLVSVAGGTLASIDLVWARAVLPPLTAGTFAAGTLASRPFLLLASVAGTIALPYAARGTLRLMDLLRAAAGLALAGTLVALAAWPLAPDLARWFYPSGYAAAAASIRVAALGGAWLAPSLFLASAALGLRRPRGQTTLAALTLLLAAACFALARTPAAFWLLAGGAGALYLARMAWVGTRARTRT